MASAAVDQSFDEQNVDGVPKSLEPHQDMGPQQEFVPEQDCEPQQEAAPHQDLEAQQDLEDQQSLEPEENLETSQKVDDGENLKTEVVENKWPGWPGDSVFRILVPAQKVGGIIGRKGEFIKKLVEETRARIKILDGPPGTPERAVIVSAKEEPDTSLPPAVDALLRVHKKVADGLDSESAAPQPGGKITTRLLVPASQTGSLIGKHGATVKIIQDKSSCIVRVLAPEDVPIFALQDDRVIEVVGEPSSVHKALELIGSHLRKFLVDHSIIPLFEMNMRVNPPPLPPQMEHMPPHQPWGPPQVFRPNAGGPHPYGGPNHHQYMPPPQQHDSYYAPPDMAPPPLEQQASYGQQHYPHGVPSYGREASMAGTPPAPTIVKQITQQIQIPLSYADTVIGEGGSTISYIRRSSGATITVQETRGVPGEMTVEISGTASQVQTAQQLVQNYIAEAAAPSQQQVAPVDQVYGSYAAANPSNSGGYDPPVYGTNYGY